MPWNSQGGGWQGGQGPWGGRPSGGGGGQQPPDLEELIRRSQEKVKNLFPRRGGGTGSGPSPVIIGIVLVVIVGLWLLTGLYRVQPDERGVRLLFGRLTGVPTEPGLHFWWPSPIGTVITPPVSRINRIEIGFRSGVTGRAGSREVGDEALMLTGDENIVDINFVVLWQIADPAEYLFNVRDPEATVKAAAESVMREIIGQTPIAEATTEARRRIEIEAREQLQNLMNEYGTGVQIDEVQMQKADPPQQVIDAFRDVQRAQADRERLQNEAESFANDIIPRARGDAERILQEAQAYREEAVARANGEASRFDQVLTEYQKVPDVTSKRIYLETMEGVLGGMNKIIIDKDASGGGSGVVPYLPLNELQAGNRGSNSNSNTGGSILGGGQ